MKIIPKNKKLLKSSKVRKYFKIVEDAIEVEIKKNPPKYCPCCGCVFMEMPNV